MLVLLFGILLTTVTGESGDYPNHNGNKGGNAHNRHTEPIPKPEIRVSPKVITEGADVSVSCHYTPTPPGEIPWLQFALYRDGTIMEGFSSASEWHISPARAQDSGNYTCAVRPQYGEEQRSAAVYIPIHAAAKEDTAKSNLLLLVGLPLLAILVVIIMVVALCKLRHKAGHTIPPSHQSNADLPLTKTPAIAVNEDPASSEDPPHPGAPSAGQDVCYTYIDINHLKKTSPAPPPTATDNDVTYSVVMPKNPN
eukprot:XP_012825101.1 PREDICTED: uncharacterized protein LOC100490516 isoform X2 [Xenopus tropicalis]